MIDEIYNCRIGAIKTYHFSDERMNKFILRKDRYPVRELADR